MSYFKTFSDSVQIDLQHQLLDSCNYHVHEASGPEKPIKIWGIDNMSTPLCMCIARLYTNQNNIEDKGP